MGPESLVAVALPTHHDLSRPARRDQDRRRLPAGRHHLPGRPPAIPASTTRAPDAWSPPETSEATYLRRSESGIDLVDSDRRRPRYASITPRRTHHRRGPATPLCADAIAYVIYTSGSTGRPKGVVVTHRNVLTLFDNTAAATSGSTTRTCGRCSTRTHSTSRCGSCGGRCCTAADWSSSTTSRPGRRTCSTNCCARERVTVLNQTPSAFYQLAEADRADHRRTGRTGPALRDLRWRGARPRTAWPLVRPARRHGPALVNMYGITETTVHVSPPRARPRDRRAASASVIGRAIAGLAVYVLDRRLRPVPPGVVGRDVRRRVTRWPAATSAGPA